MSLLCHVRHTYVSRVAHVCYLPTPVHPPCFVVAVVARSATAQAAPDAENGAVLFRARGPNCDAMHVPAHVARSHLRARVHSIVKGCRGCRWRSGCTRGRELVEKMKTMCRVPGVAAA